MKNFGFPEMQKPIIDDDEILLSNPVWSAVKRNVLIGKVNRSFYTIRKGSGVTVAPLVAFDPNKDIFDHELILIPQVRPNANNAIGWCLPAGGVDPIDNGSVLACAKRELREETGYEAAAFTDLSIMYAAVHFSDNKDTAVLAEGLTLGESAIEDSEIIGLPRAFTIGDIQEMTTTNSPEGVPYIYDGITIADIGKTVLHLIRRINDTKSV